MTELRMRWRSCFTENLSCAGETKELRLVWTATLPARPVMEGNATAAFDLKTIKPLMGLIAYHRTATIPAIPVVGPVKARTGTSVRTALSRLPY